MIANDLSTTAEADEEPMGRKFFVLLGLIVMGVFILLFDGLGAINGGGLFSTMAALHRADAKVPMVDIDSAGLRTLVIGAVCTVVLSICAYFKVDFGDRFKSGAIMLVIVGAGFLGDAIYDARVVDKFMVSKGYIRCESRDHHVGNGKSQVWFHDYVLDAKNCPTRVQL